MRVGRSVRHCDRHPFGLPGKELVVAIDQVDRYRVLARAIHEPQLSDEILNSVRQKLERDLNAAGEHQTPYFNGTPLP